MGKYITTMCLIIGGIVPIIVDTSSSHLFNPDWDAHARVHEAGRLSTNFLIFSLGIYLLWVKKNEVLSALLSLCIHLGFVFSAATMSLYGGAATGEGLPEPLIIGISLPGKSYESRSSRISISTSSSNSSSST